jgi:hypothetical protein
MENNMSHKFRYVLIVFLILGLVGVYQFGCGSGGDTSGDQIDGDQDGSSIDIAEVAQLSFDVADTVSRSLTTLIFNVIGFTVQEGQASISSSLTKQGGLIPADYIEACKAYQVEELGLSIDIDCWQEGEIFHYLGQLTFDDYALAEDVTISGVIIMDNKDYTFTKSFSINSEESFINCTIYADEPPILKVGDEEVELIMLSFTGDYNAETDSPSKAVTVSSLDVVPRNVVIGYRDHVFGCHMLGDAGSSSVWTCTIEYCDDHVDNDGNSDTDCADSECSGVGYCGDEHNNCGDGLDNDGDGLIDCLDHLDCYEFCSVEVSCENGIDDDGDKLLDCDDPDCREEPVCGLIEWNCMDGIDNDGDGLVDCEDDDPVCAWSWLCNWFEDCENDVDDYGTDPEDPDELADCLDPECHFAINCYEDCDNFDSQEDPIDDDGDGYANCADPRCYFLEGDHSCVEDCDNGLDDDQDGAIDCDDLYCVVYDQDCREQRGCGGRGGSLENIIIPCYDQEYIQPPIDSQDPDSGLRCSDFHQRRSGDIGNFNSDERLSCKQHPNSGEWCCTTDHEMWCTNWVDDDMDGFLDCEDPDCDCDLHIYCNDPSNCDDPECFGAPGCGEDCVACGDEDGDGKQNCADEDCSSVCQGIVPEDSAALDSCYDESDNDNDCLIDCDDPDCKDESVCDCSIFCSEEGRQGECVNASDCPVQDPPLGCALISSGNPLACWCCMDR